MSIWAPNGITEGSTATPDFQADLPVAVVPSAYFPQHTEQGQ